MRLEKEENHIWDTRGLIEFPLYSASEAYNTKYNETQFIHFNVIIMYNKTSFEFFSYQYT